MAALVQLIYVSRASFSLTKGRGGVPREVARILMQSRRNNPKEEVGGILFYSDGYFLQCLEGERSKVEALFLRIAEDPRHTDVRILIDRPVSERAFSDWSMKYVASQDRVRDIVRRRGYASFDPYQLDGTTIDMIMGVLTGAEDPTRGAINPSSGWGYFAFPDRRLAQLALAVAGLALMLALIALVY